jgi:hypothetical protein
MVTTGVIACNSYDCSGVLTFRKKQVSTICTYVSLHFTFNYIYMLQM